MPADAYDDFSLLPTDLDMVRLNQLEADGRVEAENGTWIVLRYPPKPQKGWSWCEFSLLLNCRGIPPQSGTHEFKNLKALLSYLEQLESKRKK